MRAGRLKHRLIIERPDIARDDSGAEVPTWVEVTTVWAAIEPIKGRELLSAGQVLADLDTRIVIRWSPRVDQITAKWRLRHAERTNPATYNISAPPVHVNLGQREIQIMARSGVNEGQ